MADELRMDAVVGDGFTSPLQALNKLLTQVGMNPAGKQVAKDWEGVSAKINKVALDIRTGLQPVMSGLGVTSLGLAGAIGTAAVALKNFAFNTRDLSLFSKSIGLSVDQLRQLKAVGERFGIDWSQAQGSLKQFAGNMDQLQRRWGEAYGRLRAMDMGDLAERLVSAPNMQTAIDRALEGIKSIQNPVRRREVAQLLFGSDQWATVARELTPTLRDEIKKLTASITPEMEAASEKFVKNWQDMQQAVDNFVVRGLGPALGPLNELINKLQQPVGDGLEKALRGINDVLAEFNKNGVVGALKKLDSLTDMGLGPRVPQGTLPDLQKQLSDKERDYRGAIERGDLVGSQVLAHELRALREAIDRLRKEAGATVQQQSFDGGGGGFAGMIQRAALGGGGFGGGGVGSPFSMGFWNNVYRSGVGGDPFRGAGRTWDQPGGSAAGKFPGGSSGMSARPGARGPSSIDYGRGGVSREPSSGNLGRGDPNNPRSMDPMAPAGSGPIPSGERATITTMSGRRIVVHRDFAENFKGFLDDYERAGGEVGPDSGGIGTRPGNSSYHPSGRAIDLNQVGYGIRSRRGVTLPEEVENQLAAKWGLYPGALFGARSDRGHFEVRNAAHALAVIERMRRGEPSGPLPSVADKPLPFDLTGDRMAEIERRRDSLSARRSGDSMMGRAFGVGGVAAGAPKFDATGSVSIHLSGGLEKAPARVSMDGLFKDVKVNRKVKMSDKGMDD